MERQIYNKTVKVDGIDILANDISLTFFSANLFWVSE